MPIVEMIDWLAATPTAGTIPEKLWFTPLVWMDYWLAMVFTLIVPLVLVIWAFVKKNQSILRLLIIYWRVASLLAITTYLFIGNVQLGFVSALLSRILIVVGLWFWVDLNEDIADQPPRSLLLTLTAWRWAMTAYMGLGAIATLPFLGCAISKPTFDSEFCRVWLDPPLLFKSLIHPNGDSVILGFWGFLGLLIYVIYFSYYLLVRLSKEGRMAIEE